MVGLPIGGLGLTDTQSQQKSFTPRSGSEAGALRARGIEDGSLLEGQGITEKNTKRSILGGLGERKNEEKERKQER